MCNCLDPIDVIELYDEFRHHFLISDHKCTEETLLNWISENRELFVKFIEYCPCNYRTNMEAIHYASVVGYNGVIKEIIAILPDAVNFIVSPINVDTINRSPTPLMLAIQNRRADTVTLLIAKGSDVNYNSKKSKLDLFTPLGYALFSTPKILSIIVSAGAEVNSDMFRNMLLISNPLMVKIVLNAMLYS